MAEITIIPAKERHGEIVRAAAYARVSSDSDDQLNSFTAQINHYTDLLKNQPHTVFVDMYADEGITGTSVQKRDDFQRLMDDCRKGKIDRIITKSVSRFARNTKDCLEAVRELKTLGVSVYFEKENIDTARITTEMFLAMYSSFAQEESVSISKNCRMGIRKRMEDGTYINPSVPYGYDFVDGKTVVNPEKAEVVRHIYDRFLQGAGVCEIAHELNMQNNFSPKRSEKWNHTAVVYILRNEKYTGDSLYQKRYTTDSLPFQLVNNSGEKPMYLISNTHEAIITKEDFLSAQELLKKHSHIITKAMYPLSKKIHCGECGTLFRYKKRVNDCCWVCRNHDKNKDNCSVKPILEKDIYNAFVKMYNKLIATYSQILTPLLKQLQALSDKYNSDNEQIISVRKETATVKEQYHLMTQLKSQGILDDEYFTVRSRELNIRLSQLHKQLCSMIKDDESYEQTEQIKRLAEHFEKARPLNDFDEIRFNQTVERITVVSETEVRFHLKGGVTFTEKINKKERKSQ